MFHRKPERSARGRIAGTLGRKPGPPSTQVVIRVPDHELAAFKRLAEERGWSLARAIKEAMRLGIGPLIAANGMPTISRRK